MLKISILLLVILSIIDGRKVRIIRNPNCQCGIPSDGKIRVKRHESNDPNDTHHAIDVLPDEVRIINGKTAEANEYPWIGNVQISERKNIFEDWL